MNNAEAFDDVLLSLHQSEQITIDRHLDGNMNEPIIDLAACYGNGEGCTFNRHPQPPVSGKILPRVNGWYWVRMPCGDHMAFVNAEAGRVVLFDEDSGMTRLASIGVIENWVGPLVCPFDMVFDPDTDWPTAGRSIALNLSEFCDQSKPYPRMVSDAARQARRYIHNIRMAIQSPVGLVAESDRAV